MKKNFFFLKKVGKKFGNVKNALYLCKKKRKQQQTMTTMKELDYYKEFTSGNTTITRCDYEEMPSPMNTSSLTDDDMQRLAEAIEQEMERWKEWLDNGDVNQDQYDEAWWKSMEDLGYAFGMTYYEDEE
jgi:hypothetical protein